MQTFDIGGSFGIKITSYPQMAVCALASKKAGGRPVKWVETRSEHMTSSAHGNERTFRDTRVALDKNGVITAITSRHIDDCGAYPRYEPLGCVIWSQVFPGVYRFKNARIDFSQAVTNKCPVGPNRGYSRMQHLWFLERVVDICAHELGIPADEMRLRNYIRPEEFPYTTPNGCVYDSGNYPKMLEVAKNLIGWDELEEEAGGGTQRRPHGRNRHRHDARFRHQQLRPVADRESGRAVLRQLAGRELQTRYLWRGRGRGRILSAGPGTRNDRGTGSRRCAEHHPDLITVRTGFDTERNVHTGFSGTYASQFAVSGLVGGPRRGTETEG